jgi:D-beta-D-heptose 7-phosphate kinase/D-beta-D-heptose 1-phosphate adenosyltransferase
MSAVNNKQKKEKVVAISGGFDPVHNGHIRLFQEASKLGDKLIIILNNDNWLKAKKGFAFMSERTRKEILQAIKGVDEVVLTSHGKNCQDMSVCAELKKIRPDIFANGGDRKKTNIPEVAVCKEIGCKMVFNVGRGGKIESSSWLLENFLKNLQRRNQ